MMKTVLRKLLPTVGLASFVLACINHFLLIPGDQRPRIETQDKPLEKETEQKSANNSNARLLVLDWKEIAESFDRRVNRVKYVCEKYNNVFRPEYGSLYGSEYLINACSKMYFLLNRRIYSVCNILKGGLNSWKDFFNKNQIEFNYAVECPDCQKKKRQHILQVRHPLERLISSWRHVFLQEGWRTLDGRARILKPEQISQEILEEYRNITWPTFIQKVIIENSFMKNMNLSNVLEYDTGKGWLVNHWAPIWFTCGVCKPDELPDYIIKMETVDRDQHFLLNMLEADPSLQYFQKVKVLGEKKDVQHSSEFYYSQLTKSQVKEVYEVYKLDHELFGYNPQKYIDWAQSDTI